MGGRVESVLYLEVAIVINDCGMSVLSLFYFVSQIDNDSAKVRII
jgi:hypothetical protein